MRTETEYMIYIICRYVPMLYICAKIVDWKRENGENGGKNEFFGKKVAGKFVDSKNSRTFATLSETNGCLAQLVQSICLTSRGSAVRIRQHPHRGIDRKVGSFFCLSTKLFYTRDETQLNQDNPNGGVSGFGVDSRGSDHHADP